MKNKSFIIITTILALSLFGYYIAKDAQETKIQMAKIQELKNLKKRTPSSTKSLPKPKSTIKKALPSKEELKVQEKIVSALDQEEMDINLEKVGVKLYPKFSHTINFVHYKVSIKSRKNQMQSSYDALVDPSNGHIIRTWNKTQFEYPKKITFNTVGQEYNP